jgi:hypothetical protein
MIRTRSRDVLVLTETELSRDVPVALGLSPESFTDSYLLVVAQRGIAGFVGANLETADPGQPRESAL